MTSKQESLGALTFGLDISIASVGWAVLGESRIVDLGVRCFDKAETAKEGESLNLARRTAKLLRRRLRRRAWRLTKLARLLKREELIADTNFFKHKIEKNTPVPKSAWQLCVDALDRHLLGLSGLWQFPEKVVGVSFWDDCFHFFEQSLSTLIR